MDSKLTVSRVVLSVLARRALRFATIIGAVILVVLFALCWVLATYVSGWWWLLLIVYIPLLLLAIIVRLFAGFLVGKLYSKPLLKHQKNKVNNFVDKLQRLAEARGMGWPVFAFLSLKDLVLYRDLRTARSTFDDTASLRKDFAELERTFTS